MHRRGAHQKKTAVPGTYMYTADKRMCHYGFRPHPTVFQKQIVWPTSDANGVKILANVMQMILIIIITYIIIISSPNISCLMVEDRKLESHQHMPNYPDIPGGSMLYTDTFIRSTYRSLHWKFMGNGPHQPNPNIDFNRYTQYTHRNVNYVQNTCIQNHCATKKCYTAVLKIAHTICQSLINLHMCVSYLLPLHTCVLGRPQAEGEEQCTHQEDRG